MSTFKGIVAEFTQIRIDYFRKIPDKPPPLACFLSHVHSDHLLGLDSLKSPFVYCSPATKELLLRLEKYPHRMNFAKGILETRRQTYKHLKSLLKTIPLCTPTNIELSPGNEIRVTFFDANHCAGAVSILVQGSGKAILYTGDVRSEAWWVESLKRQPLLIPYTIGSSRLDRIYLDTTFATNLDPYRQFQPKAEGLKELLDKVSKYPPDTVFHFNAWTFGYEDVWIALSAALQTPIHLDNYRMRLYNAFVPSSLDQPPCIEGPALCGYKCGNRNQAGCLTADAGVRLHSCERGTSCPRLEACNNIVSITPIISRLSNGLELPELGAGGGRGDLDQFHELEISDHVAVAQLMSLCANKIKNPRLLAKVIEMLSSAMAAHQNSIRLTVAEADDARDFKLTQVLQEDLPLQELVDIVAKVAVSHAHKSPTKKSPADPISGNDELPQHITFPYSRHSSYEELCFLVQAFKPRDVYPCTVDEKTWTTDVSMKALFGHLCSATDFAHDEEMRQKQMSFEGLAPKQLDDVSKGGRSQPSLPVRDESETESEHEDQADPSVARQEKQRNPSRAQGTASEPIFVPDVDASKSFEEHDRRPRAPQDPVIYPKQPEPAPKPVIPELKAAPKRSSSSSHLSERSTTDKTHNDDPKQSRELRIKRQRRIYQNILVSSTDTSDLGLVSTYDNHSKPELEL